MRTKVITIVFFLLIALRAGGYNYIAQKTEAPPDTVLPAPSGQPAGLNGPSYACVGTTSLYYTDIPVGCHCQWSVNGIIQPDTLSPPSITWIQNGLKMVEVIFHCDNGQGPGPAAMNVFIPEAPDVFLGNDTSILQGQSLILDAGNPGSHYLWSTGDTTRFLTVTATGRYSVNVINYCGEDADTIDVSVFIGIGEPETPAPCFRFSLHDRGIQLSGIPEGKSSVRLISAEGKLLYGGVPGSVISVTAPGIYFISVEYGCMTCTRKILIH
jgi:hypothetical protein